MNPTSIFLMILLLFFSRIQAQNDTDPQKQKIEKVYITTRLTTEKPVINGVLDDDCWQNNKWTGDFIQWIPN